MCVCGYTVGYIAFLLLYVSLPLSQGSESSIMDMQGT